jgi:hypothetical protein
MMRSTAFAVPLLVLFAGSAPLPAAGESSAVGQMQERRLFEPTEAELHQEAEGSVYIYDGLTDKSVQRALDQEFERVGNMMFIRTIATDDQGVPKRDPYTGELQQDEDCD